MIGKRLFGKEYVPKLQQNFGEDEFSINFDKINNLKKLFP